MDTAAIRAAWENMEAARQTGNNEGLMRHAQTAAQVTSESFREFEANSFDGSNDAETITATVNGRGSVTGMYISPHAIRDHRAEELGAQCVSAVNAARAAMNAAMASHLNEIHEIVPPQSDGTAPSAREIVDGMRRGMEPSL